MATATWSPTDGGQLFSLPETSGPIEYQFSAEATAVDPITGMPAPVPVSDYDYELTPSDTTGVFTFTVSSSGVTLQADTLSGLFPIQFIEYLLNGELYRVFHWDDLPESAEEVITFRPSTETEKSFTLTVTASADGEPIEQSWTLVLTQDWTAGKNRLQEEVDARR